MSEGDLPNVRSDTVGQFLTGLWLLLFGGRWVLAPILQYTGVLPPAQLAMLDELVLLNVYLVLLSATCVVAAVRGVRAAVSRRGSQRSSNVDCGSRAGGPTCVASPGGDEARD